MKKNYNVFWYQEEFLNINRQTFYDTTLIMLGRTMYLTAILLLVRYRFQNHWLMVSTILKYGQQIKVNRQ